MLLCLRKGHTQHEECFHAPVFTIPKRRRAQDKATLQLVATAPSQQTQWHRHSSGHLQPPRSAPRGLPAAGDAGPLPGRLPPSELAAAASWAIWLAAPEFERDTGAEEGCKVRW